MKLRRIALAYKGIHSLFDHPAAIGRPPFHKEIRRFYRLMRQADHTAASQAQRCRKNAKLIFLGTLRQLGDQFIDNQSQGSHELTVRDSSPPETDP
jgi:hypothetical protein